MGWGKVKRRLLEAMLMFGPGLYSRWSMSRSTGTPAEVPSTERPRVLLVDHDFPEIDRDAGSRAISCFADLLVDAGMEVVFWSATIEPSAAGRAALEGRGITPLSRRETGALDGWLAKSGGSFIGSVSSRPLIAAMYLPVLRAAIAGTHLYYGHDIHYLRLQLMRATSKATLADHWQCLLMRVVEQRAWRNADVVLYPSKDEAETVNRYLADRGLAGNGEMFPLWTVDAGSMQHTPGPGKRSGLLFVGSMAHAPNADGLDWFLHKVLPLLQRGGQAPVLTVVGSGMENYRVPQHASDTVRILGRIDDAALERCYASTRLVIAPLRFGGGVKGKVIEAIGQGVPIILTGAAAQGLAGVEDILPTTDDPSKFAAAIQALDQDDQAWSAASTKARLFLAEHYDHRQFVQRLRHLLLHS